MAKLPRFRVIGIVVLVFFGAIFLAVTLSNTTTFAQTVCGSITNLQGTSNPYFDCQNPFGAESFFPFAVDISGITLADQGEYELPLAESLDISYEETDVYQFINLSLYEHDGTDFVALPLITDELEEQFSVTFDQAGDYTIVIRGEELVTQATPRVIWLAKLKDFFFNQVYAQTEDDEDGQLFVLNFTILEEELPPAPCGVIFDILGDPEPIADCDNPLGLAHPNPDLVVTFAETLLETAGQYDFLGATSTFTVDTTDSTPNLATKILYQHSGENFITKYQNIGSYTFTATGTYSLVVEEEELTPTFRTLEKWRSLIIPIAFAAHGDRTIITFEVTGAPPEPPGPSSILFLPGIQASRLYLGDGTEEKLWEPSLIDGNNDVELLALDDTGESIADVRTEDVIDEAVFPVVGSNIYKGFMNFLDDLVADDVITAWTPFAYDWRYDVFDIVDNGTLYRDGSVPGVVKYPIEEIEKLAQSSKSGKVTLIGHSNGGLLAKAIMRRLEEQNKTALIDQIIFIGTPHLGAPKALATVLHGYDQEKVGGYIIDDVVARQVIRNMPGVYSLLPTAKYFENTDSALVTFDNSPTTASFRNAYGQDITTIEELSNFIVGNEDPENRADVDPSAINEPIGGNALLLNRALASHNDQLDNWTAPSEVSVHEIVGTGLLTIASLEYREITETVCNVNVIPLTCSKQKFLKPYGKLTKYGDETVISRSSNSAVGNKTESFVNLRDLNDEFFIAVGDTYIHSNFTEIPQIQELFENLLTNNELGEIDFITNTEPTFNEEYIIESIDSPVNIFATDDNGKVTGIVEVAGESTLKKEIPGSGYVTFGDTKYLILPKNTEHTTKLWGESLGGYTLTISLLNSSDEQTVLHQIDNATTTDGMIAEFKLDNGLYSDVTIDYNGDGVIDEKMTIDGEIINPLEPEITYKTLKSAISNLTLKPIYRLPLLTTAELAEFYSKKSESNPKYKAYEIKTLDGLILLIKGYVKKKLINADNGNNIVQIIEYLKNN